MKVATRPVPRHIRSVTLDGLTPSQPGVCVCTSHIHGTDYYDYHRRLPLAWDAARAALGPNARGNAPDTARAEGPEAR